MTAQFECLACGAPISADRLRERMKAPPGACDDCGHAVVRLRDGETRREIRRIADEAGVGMVDIHIGPHRP